MYEVLSASKTRENSHGLLSFSTRNSGVEGGVTPKAGIIELKKTQWKHSSKRGQT